jgi:hypothetical protein
LPGLDQYQGGLSLSGESESQRGTDPGWPVASYPGGRIIAAGITKEVGFEPVEGPINDSIDDAYRLKYGGSPYLKPMLSERARSDGQDNAARHEWLKRRRLDVVLSDRIPCYRSRIRLS